MERKKSKIVRSRVPSILKMVPAWLFSCVARIPLDQARTLKTDERVLPPVRLMEGLCLRFGIKPADIVSLDPAGSLRDIAPEWFENGSAQARIAVCGMGNLGHVFAGVLSARSDVSVSVLVSSEDRANEIRKGLEVEGGIRVLRDEGDILGRPHTITHQPEIAINDADLVILCVPSHCHLRLLRKVAPWMKEGSYVTCAPSWGGFNWKAQTVLEETGKGIGVFGIGGIPWMCKLQKPGAAVRVSGTKQINALLPLRASDSVFATDLMSCLLEMPMIDMGNFLNLTLAPGNQILHPGIMYALFKDWTGEPFSEAPLFYEGLSQEGVEILQAMNDELVAAAAGIHAQVPDYWMSATVSLHLGIRLGYEDQIADPSTLRSAIVTNKAYQGIRAPMRPGPNGLVPDFDSRFFLEDIPHGMAIVKGIAEIAGIETPVHDRVLSWCQERMGKEYLVGDRLCGRDVGETAAPQVFGITDPATLVERCTPLEPQHGDA
jgi:hypothetical protein